MNYRKLLLVAALGLSACDGSNSSYQPDTSTFPAAETVPSVPTPIDESQAQIDRAQALAQAGKLEEAADIFRNLGMLEEAYKLFTPADHIINDPTAYEGDASTSLSEAVDETPSVKRNAMQIGGETVWFTARAGHLTATAPKDPKNPDKKDAEASIFYTYYSRDDLPKDKRPVTFFFNGGPGSSSVWLHMGSWAPKRLKTDEPNIPPQYQTRRPTKFPQIDNAETLLDQSDLVFVDPVGTGLSEAIEPHRNLNFWDMDKDAEVSNDFITRFINYYNRQSSPKYLYGESYSGIRVPIMAAKLLAAGQVNFEPDPTGKPPVVLSGLVLNSPILNYQSQCNVGVSCNGNLPTYAMTADYYHRSQRGDLSVPDFLNSVRKFGSEEYDVNFWLFPQNTNILAVAKKMLAMIDGDIPTPFMFQSEVEKHKVEIANVPEDQRLYALNDIIGGYQYSYWDEYYPLEEGSSFLKKLSGFTGLPGDEPTDILIRSPNLGMEDFRLTFFPGKAANMYDTRMSVPGDAFRNLPYDISFYEDPAFTNAIKPQLSDLANYNSSSIYQVIPDIIIQSWKYQRDPKVKYWKSSIVDLQSAIRDGEGLKVLVMGGYTDLVTPFHQTELDLAEAGLTDRVPVKWFNGGHMTYLTEESRKPMKAELDKFYAAPPVDVAVGPIASNPPATPLSGTPPVAVQALN